MLSHPAKNLVLFLLLFLTVPASAQINADSVNRRVDNIEKVLNVLRDFRISSYIQPQFQRTDTNGVATYNGGDFPTHAQNRFILRRARLKVQFDHVLPKKGFKIIETAFQFDITEKGFTVRDLYGRVIDPWTGWVGIMGGIFNRPFGFDVSYSSGVRETPERGRMSQTLFKDERDLGMALVIESPATFKLMHLRLDAALVNGTGPFDKEMDNRKDFIGQLEAGKTFGKITKFSISGGVSYYNGAVVQSTPNTYIMRKDADGGYIYNLITDTAGIGRKYYKREYYGADIQLVANYKIGTTTLRGEFIAGTQPGMAANPISPNAIGSDLYIRPFNGAYFYFIQTMKQKINTHTIYHDFVFRYDWYDPNALVSGRQLSTSTDIREGRADVKYHTFSMGYIFRPYEWFKLMVNYEIVQNEITDLKGYDTELRDNIFTLRTQFTFDTGWFVKKK